MVIEFPKDKKSENGGFFLRSDVRETAGITGAPKIGDYTNAQHDHSNVIGGGSVVDSSAGVKGVIIVAGGEGVDSRLVAAAARGSGKPGFPPKGRQPQAIEYGGGECHPGLGPAPGQVAEQSRCYSPSYG